MIRIARLRCLVLAFGISVAATAPSLAQTKQPLTQKFESGGIAMELVVSSADASSPGLVAGGNATVRLHVTDARSNEPIRGARPRAWITAGSPGASESDAACQSRVRSLMSGALASRADINLNSYLLLTLNDDKTITFINPQVSLSVTKMESLIALPSQGVDWTLSKNGDAIFVSMPETSSVAVVDTSARKILEVLKMGESSAPTRVALQPDGQYVWIALDGSGEVAAIDAVTHALAQRIKVGAGLHSFAFSPDSRRAYVTNSADDSVSIVDTTRLAKVTDLKVAVTPIALAYGSVGRVLYVAGLNAEQLTVIDAERDEVIGDIPIGRGAVSVAFEPSGRFALVLKQFENKVIVIDSANNKVTTVAAVAEEPDQIAFTQRYAYVRGLKSENFTLFDLLELKAGKAEPVHIQAGSHPPAAQTDLIDIASMMAPTPEGNSVMIANAAEGMLYYYVEGMMAPMGTFSTYKRLPRALAVLDRSLREDAPGEYSAPIRLPHAGRFDVPVFVEQPRLVTCFSLTIQGDVAAIGAHNLRLRIEAVFPVNGIETGAPSTIRLNVLDAESGTPVAGLGDLSVLVLQEAGLRQHHPVLRELNNGLYEFTLAFNRPGAYRLLVAAPSRNMRLRDLPAIAFSVRDAPRTATSP